MVGPRGGKSQSYAGRKVLKDRFQPAAKKQKQLAAELGAIGGAVVGGMQGAGGGGGAGGAGAGAGEAGAGGAGGEAGGSGAGAAGAGAPRGLQLELDISPILKKVGGDGTASVRERGHQVRTNQWLLHWLGWCVRGRVSAGRIGKLR